MRETLDISDSILKQLAETPQERLYWSCGVRMIAPLDCYGDYLFCYDSERAAWINRERLLREYPDLYSPDGYPKSQTRSEVNQRAKEYKRTTVNVRDETGAIVESWEVE